MRAAIYFEFDFAAKRREACGLCDLPFLKHFQPPADADPRLSTNWCPNPCREGQFTSRAFKSKEAVK